MSAKIFRSILVLFVVFSCSGALILADKVTLVNGDTMTGQVKKLDNGVLHLTYFKQTIELPWQ